MGRSSFLPIGRLLGLVVLFASAVVVQAATIVSLDPLQPLDKKVSRHLERGVALLRNGRFLEAHQQLQPILESAKPLELLNIRLHLNQAKLNRSLADLVVDARLSALRDNKQFAKKPGPVELSRLLPVLKDELDRLTKPARDELDIAHQVNAPHAVLDIKSATLVKMIGQMDEGREKVASIKSVVSRVEKQTIEKLSKDAQSAAKMNFVEEDKKLVKMHDELLERLVELNMVRVADNVQLLTSGKVPYQARLAASLRAGDGLSNLNSYWTMFKRRKNKSPELGAIKKLEDQWRGSERVYAEKVGQLKDKAYHFDEGKKWWLRARYGQGQLAGGMMKYAPQPGHSSDVQQLYYPLEMPDPFPAPPHPINQPNGPPVARKHMLLWEGAQIDPTNQGGRNRFFATRSRGAFSGSVLPAKLEPWIDAEPRCVKWVGYLEYQMALYHFGKVLEMTSGAERDTLEEWIASDDRFVVPSGLSTRYDSNPQVKQSSIQFYGQRTEAPRARFQYERRGLSWVMALARVELGAMRAAKIAVDLDLESVDAYVRRVQGADLRGQARIDQQNQNRQNLPGPNSIVNFSYDIANRDSSGPFHKFRPTSFDRSAFLEILFDGARQQYCSIVLNVAQPRNDASPSRDFRDAELLLSRLTIAIEFVSAANEQLSPTMTARQRVEMENWEKHLISLRDQIAQRYMTQYGNTLAASLDQNFRLTRRPSDFSADNPRRPAKQAPKATNPPKSK